MKRDNHNLDWTLDRYMGLAGEPPAGQVTSSVEEVWERLKPEAECSILPAPEMVTPRSHFPFSFAVVAAVVIAMAAIGLYAAQRAGMLPAMFAGQPQARQSVEQRITRPSETAAVPAPATNSKPEQPVGVAVAEAVPSKPQQPSSANAGQATPLQRTDGNVDSKLSQSTTPPTTPLSFEVAAIRQVAPPYPTEGGPWLANNGRFSADHAWIRGVIAVAYDLNKTPLVKGGPAWVDQEQYDIDARAGSASAGLSQIRLMLQTLLKERFKLAVHFGTEEARVYTLAVAKNGSKLQAVRNPLLTSIKWNGTGSVTFTEDSSLAGLSNVLGGLLGVPVYNETGLRGTYNFNLDFTDPRDPRPRKPDSPPDLFTAVKEQLGLELHETRRPVRFIVIDHIERPSPN